MKKTILTLIFLWIPALAFSQSVLEEDYLEMSVAKLKDIVAKNLSDFDASEKEMLSQKVILSKRVDLILTLLEESEIQLFLAEKIKKLPEDGFKAAIIASSLKKNDLWVEKQKVNKGDQMTMMISLCESTLAHYFPDDPVGWSEYSNKNARERLAVSLIKVLNGDAIGKRDKSLYPSLPLHESSLESDLSFEEGWSGDGNGKKKKLRHQLRESNLDGRRNRELTPRSNEKSQRQSEQKEPEKKFSLPWIIVCVLLLGILALLVKVFKGKSTS